MDHSTAPADDTLHAAEPQAGHTAEPVIVTDAIQAPATDALDPVAVPGTPEHIQAEEAAESAPSDSPVPVNEAVPENVPQHMPVEQSEVTLAERSEVTLAEQSEVTLAEQSEVTLAEQAMDTDDDAAAARNEEAHEEPADDVNGFADLGLSEEIQRALLEKGYRQPTPIQAQAIPTVLMGRDVLGCAQTGTGKTASFVLPMLDILSGSRSRARMPRSLILEPTRELALQVAENFVQYGKYLKLTHALLIGGESLNDQKDVLMKGVDVLIATPGRLMDLFERGGLLLTDTALLVIDEADRMLDMGFIPDVEKIVGFLPKTRQTLFFSATMAPEIRRLADAFLQNPKEITVSRPASIATTIVAGLTVVDDLDKREALRRMLQAERNVQNALIFCNRKRDVDILYKSLKRHGFSVGQLHGDMSQPERFATLQRFKNNELQLLCCSDVAARGIDIGGLSHVFNFDVPIHAEDYVHRIGRTGRAGMTGHAYTLATPDDAGFVRAIEKLVGAEIPRFSVEGMDILPFNEDDGKRRGRGRGKPVIAKSGAKLPVKEAAPDGAAPARKPRRSRAKVPAPDVMLTPMPIDAPQPVVDEVPVPRRRPEAARPPRDDFRAPREDRPRDDRPVRDDRVRPRDEPRRHFRRDDDLGPAVMGFGDDVPAFMLLRSRPIRTPEPVSDGE
jgi:superfamily II DNA/RNA helicase